ncbi:hypothetical protein [Arsukibacterium indicum]|uniref:ABC transporter substrate-binding protein n=1 Tax=Arsukibacterium indicum TaxID=2848612 RepID=A0ABS6MLW7_9GAMM|nr:hypothetical protein [Arsukibacterium indicum]MBV2129792.1 hypothetical protein [Arsukibacterium indicum]
MIAGFSKVAAVLMLLGTSGLAGQENDGPELRLSVPVTETDTNVIHWAINDAPPFHVLHGEYQRNGICDVLTSVVHRYLPEQQLSYLQMPQPRISQALDNKEPVCFPCMIYKPEGEARAVYSLPTHFYYPHHIITSAATAKTLRALYGEPVSLEKLLDDPRFRLGYPSGRRYGVLQPLLNEHDPYLARAGTGGAVAILHMITSGRLDYTIDYPIVANYYQQLYSRNMETLEIAETNGRPVAGAIGCANTAWGQSKIAEINKVISRIRQDPELLEVLQLWHSNNRSDDNDFESFNQQWLQKFDDSAAEAAQGLRQ